MVHSAVGKACLAFMDEAQTDAVLAQTQFTAFTRNSHHNSDSVKRELLKVRKQAFAVDNEEFSEGLRCVASPLFDHNSHVIGALSVSGPSVRISETMMQQIGRQTHRTASELTKALGGVWPS